MIDNYTTVIYGWKITGRNNVHKFINELECWDDEYYDKVDNIIVEDTMCGEYIYFGAIISHYDANEGGEVIINNKNIKIATDKWNNFIKENPEFNKIIESYKKGEPQLYVFQNIC